MKTRLLWFVAGVCVLGACAVTPRLLAQERDAQRSAADRDSVQALVNDLRMRLAIPETVDVTIVANNALMMSVRAPRERDDPFQLSVDASFLTTLDEADVEAAVAHELGHVWVFTHFPYLQTEQLANEIAMRVVTRESLARLYDKVWAMGGLAKGDIAGFLGLQQPAAGLAPGEHDPTR